MNSAHTILRVLSSKVSLIAAGLILWQLHFCGRPATRRFKPRLACDLAFGLRAICRAFKLAPPSQKPACLERNPACYFAHGGSQAG